MSFKAAVIGASGYAGIEVCRILLEHPEFELVTAVSDSFAQTPIASIYPSFVGKSELSFSSRESINYLDIDVAFLAVPHTASLEMTPKLVDLGVVVVDLSADFRLKDASVYEHYYQVKHTEGNILSQSFFGLPELERDAISDAHGAYTAGKSVVVACAGCYPTASSLAAVPAIRAGLVDLSHPVIVDAISGVTGAGRGANARTHFCSANDNLSVYGLLEHRHTPEMEQIMGASVLFTPHLAPVNRGILSTATMKVNASFVDSLSDEAIFDTYNQFYNGSSFISVLGSDILPQTSSVVGTNNAQVAVRYSRRTSCLLAVCAIDNLCKGAAGQAIQCANIVFGLSETAGLATMALPV